MESETLGDYRVGISFNPSKEELVDRIKHAAAMLIDMCEEARTDGDDPEKARLWSLAQTHFEDGAMWAVKAATKKARNGG